jgi:hypothetical protein
MPMIALLQGLDSHIRRTILKAFGIGKTFHCKGRFILIAACTQQVCRTIKNIEDYVPEASISEK